jgi:hypothetical protein
MAIGYRRFLSVAFVVLVSFYFAYLEFGYQSTGDYSYWYAPTMNALLGGHLGAFLHSLPTTSGAGGSVLLRAPFALIGKLVGGTQLATFRFGALECELAAGLLGLWLAREMRRAGRSPLARAAVIFVCVLGPAKADGIFFGHPEELLGATLAVASVLLANAGRSTQAGIVLGLAMVNKPWGLLAIAPAALLAGPGRVRLLLTAGAVEALWLGLALAAGPTHLAQTLTGATGLVVAHPVDLWWPLAHQHTAPGVTPAYFPPRVLSDYAHGLAILLAVPLSVLLARRSTPSLESCLALLALLFLLRCMLDPSNHVYYQVPFLIALTAWEAKSRATAPVLALSAALLIWLVFHTVAGVAGLDAQFAAYLLVTLPFVVILGRAALSLPAPARSWPRALAPA